MFFFKQKTAYEMRISDWSSDVCSSDLATISATFPALFPTPVRFAGFAIAYNVSTSIFGGTAPAVGSALIGWTGDQLMPAYYMILSCLVGLVALRFMPETAGRSLRGDPFARPAQIGRASCRERVCTVV